MNSDRFPIWRTTAALLLGVSLLLVLHTHGPLLRKLLLSVLAWWIAPAILLGMVWRREENPARTDLRPVLPLLVLFAMTVLYLVSSATIHRWFYFQDR